MLKRLIRQLMQAAMAMAVTFQAGNWAVRYAYENRGYEAAGGEYLFIPIVYLGVYAGSCWLFDMLEEIRWNRSRERQLAENGQDNKGVTERC